jgi:hypothetical protein
MGILMRTRIKIFNVFKLETTILPPWKLSNREKENRRILSWKNMARNQIDVGTFLCCNKEKNNGTTNLNYINDLSGDNTEFKQKLLAILKLRTMKRLRLTAMYL